MEVDLKEESAPRRRFKKRWLGWALLAWWGTVATWNVVKPMPPGTNVSSPIVTSAASDVEFLYDLTSTTPAGKPLREQRIFDEVFDIIDNARSFVIADFFLLNDMMGAESGVHRPLSRELADHLLARKASQPEFAILLITDPINDVYGGMPSPLLDELRAAGIDVINTNLDPLRDSNPGYSALWRMFLQWWGNSDEGGSMTNPFAPPGSPPITLRSWLALANFKANHRKVIAADQVDGTLTALVTSANPHDGSSEHSNVAVRFNGPLVQEIINSEMAIARFSGWRGHIYSVVPSEPASTPAEPVQVQFLTEQAIRDHLLDAIDTTRNGDSIRIATFYLSDRKIVNALLRSASRGVQVRLILDPNRDAFGRQKDGVPNRPAATELVERSGEKIEVRWYRTHGEQFHTKLALVTHGERLIASLGSANLTRRNIGNYNLEANVGLELRANSALGVELTGYFDRLWNNDGPPGTGFTAPFGAWRDDDTARYWRYRLMEATGLSTF
ncbi:MAG TPA: phospholipase D-like domain-containing protein [Steroidobacter sp.]|uniref:phospholipase D-like domain-containing protein n=1 Tax=Steroidobacter sp. TaxID=1978227 RepID=UPI002ED97749